MYKEWMDGIPICIKGYHIHNAREFMRVADYYEKLGYTEMVERYRKAANEELEKQKEKDSSNFLEKILKNYINRR